MAYHLNFRLRLLLALSILRFTCHLYFSMVNQLFCRTVHEFRISPNLPAARVDPMSFTSSLTKVPLKPIPRTEPKFKNTPALLEKTYLGKTSKAQRVAVKIPHITDGKATSTPGTSSDAFSKLTVMPNIGHKTIKVKVGYQQHNNI